MQELFDSLVARQTVRFRYGIARGRPMLAAGSLTAVGAIDLDRQRVRMVTTGLPDDFLKSIPARSRNPLSRLAFAGLRSFFEKLATLREVRYDGALASTRSGPTDDWMEMPTETSDGRPSINNPAWILQLLRAPDTAVTVREEPGDAGERELDITIDLSAVEAWLPDPLVADLRGPERDRLVQMPMRVSISEQGLPTSIAISPMSYSDTGEASWAVLALTSHGDPFEEVDLWRAWHEAAPAKP